VYTSDGRALPTRTIVTTIGNGPSEFVKSLPIALERGRIPVSAELEVAGLTNVWSLGDAALVPVAGDEYALPTAQSARQQAEILAGNILRRHRGEALRPFKQLEAGMMASLGGNRGVAELFGMRVTGLLAWLIWRVAYIGMLPGIATRIRVGLDWLFDYFMPRTIVYMAESDRPATRYLNYAKGEVVQYANELPAGFYIVLSGRLEQLIKDSAGVQAQRELQAGDSWGSRALKEHRLTHGKITALEDSKLLLVKSEDFQRLRNAYEPLNNLLAENER
jgi:NADH dehydrogenase